MGNVQISFMEKSDIQESALSSNYPIVEYSRTGFIKDTTCTNKKGIIDTWIKRLL